MKKYLLIISILILFVASPVSASQIVDHAGVSDGLIACWDMDEGSNETRLDASANGYNLSNNGTNGVESVSGTLGNAADFTISEVDFLSITNADGADLGITGDFTIMGWFDPDAADTMVVANKGYAAGSRSYKLSIERTSNQITQITSADCTNVGNSAPSMTDPYGSGPVHTVYTYDASAGTGDFFFDSVDSGNFTGLNTSICDTTFDFHLGARNNGGTGDQSYGGSMDIVAIFSEIKTQGEIDTIYGGGTAPLACAAAAGGGAKFIEISVEWADKHRELKLV